MTDTANFTDASPQSVSGAMALVEKIQEHSKTKRNQTPKEEAAKLRRLQNRILGSLDDAAHVVPELLQNADDVGKSCTEATIRLNDDELVIENDGEAMSEVEIKALGEFAESTKRDLSQIGHFGIGFKTAFSVTDRPHVDTGYVSLEYSKEDPEIPQTAFEEAETQFNGTRVRLPLSEELSDTRLDEIRSHLNSIERLLPFLNNLQTINAERDGKIDSYERIVNSEKDGAHVTVHKYDSENEDTPCDTWHYRIFTDSLDADSETVKALADERELKLEALESRDVNIEVEIAFPVSDQGYPTTYADDKDSRLFCYFPASQDTDMPFDVQADFLLKSSREQIRSGHHINNKLLRVAGSLIKNAIHTFQSENVPPSELLTLIPPSESDRPAYLNPLTDEVFNTVSTINFVPVESGGTCVPEDLLILPSQLRDVLPLSQFCTEYEPADASHPAQELTKTDYQRLENLSSTRVLSFPETIEQIADMDFLSVFKPNEVIELFAIVEKYLSSIRKYDDKYDKTIEALKSLPVYSIRGDTQNRQRLTKINKDVYRPVVQGGSTYKPFYNELTLIGDSLLSALRSKNVSDQKRVKIRKLFSKRLDIQEIQHKDIVENVVAEAFLTPKDHDSETLDEYVEYLRDHAQAHANASNTKLRTKNGEYKPPKELYLPKEYLEDQYDSSLVLGSLTDRDPISTSYIGRNPDVNDTEDWREFFASLGSLTHLPVSLNVDRSTKQSFQNQDEIQAYLDDHNDEGTHVRPDRDTTPYGGRDKRYRWMKRTDAQHGLVDYAVSKDHAERFEDAAGTTDRFGTEFIKMLAAYWKSTDTDWGGKDTHWDGTYQNSMFYDYCWSVQNKINTEESECPTSFLTLLRKTAWLLGRDEKCYQPSHLYQPNSRTEQADVPLLSEQISCPPNLLNALNVADDVGLEQHVNAIEQVVNERPESSVAEIDEQVRSYLYPLNNLIDSASKEEMVDLSDQLFEIPFIYVENAEPKFRTPDQVVWSTGLGDFAVAINKDYGMFRNLFLNALDIDPEPTLDDYVRYLGQADGDDWSTVEKAWKEVIKRVAYHDHQEYDLKEVAADLAERGNVPTVAKTLVKPDEIQYVAQDMSTAERLPRDLAEQIALQWYDGRKTDHPEAVKRVTTLLNATVLDKELDREIISPSLSPNGTTFYENYQLQFNVGNSLLADRNKENAQEQLEGIADYTIQEAESIMCRYRVGSDSRRTDEPIYIDQNNSHVYVTDTETASLQLAEAIAVTIELTGATRNKFVELIRGALGKNNDLVKAYLNSRDLLYEPVEHARREEVHGENESIDDRFDDEERTENDTSQDMERGESEESDDGTPVKTDDEPPTGSDTCSSEGQSSDTEPNSEEESDESGGEADSNRNEREDDSSTDSRNGEESSEIYGPDGHETGNKGEKFVLRKLLNMLKSELDSDDDINLNNKSGEYCIKGDSRGRTVTVTVKKVPDREEPHSDLLIKRASLKREGDRLVVDRIATDEQTLIEVKSSKKKAKNFTITKAEYEEARENSEYLIVRPIKVGSKDERIETVFDTLPQIVTESTRELKITRLEYDSLMVSYE